MVQNPFGIKFLVTIIMCKQQFTMFQHLIAYITEKVDLLSFSNVGIVRKISNNSFLRRQKGRQKKKHGAKLKTQATKTPK